MMTPDPKPWEEKEAERIGREIADADRSEATTLREELAAAEKRAEEYRARLKETQAERDANSASDAEGRLSSAEAEVARLREALEGKLEGDPKECPTCGSYLRGCRDCGAEYDDEGGCGSCRGWLRQRPVADTKESNG